MQTLTLSDEAMWLLFHTFNNHRITPALQEGMLRLQQEKQNPNSRLLFGGPHCLHAEIMGALINAQEE